MRDNRVTDTRVTSGTTNLSHFYKQNRTEHANNCATTALLEQNPNDAYLVWSKNSIERLMISSSVIILLSSSATSPRSSFDPLEAIEKKTHMDEYPENQERKKERGWTNNFIWNIQLKLNNNRMQVFNYIQNFRKLSLWWQNQKFIHVLSKLTIYRVLCVKVSPPLHFIWGHSERQALTSLTPVSCHRILNLALKIMTAPL